MKKIYSRIIENGSIDRIQIEEINGELFVTGFNKGDSPEIVECAPVKVSETVKHLLNPESLYSYQLEV